MRYRRGAVLLLVALCGCGKGQEQPPVVEPGDDHEADEQITLPPIRPKAVSLQVTGGAIRGVAWRPDGSLVTLTESTLQVWDLSKPETPIASPDIPGLVAPARLAVSPSGNRMVIGGNWGDVLVWEGGKEPPEPLLPKGSGEYAFLSEDWLLRVKYDELFARHLGGDRTTSVPLGPASGGLYCPPTLALSGNSKMTARLIQGNKMVIARVAIRDETVTLERGITLDDCDSGSTPALNRDGSLLFVVGSRAGE